MNRPSYLTALAVIALLVAYVGGYIAWRTIGPTHSLGWPSVQGGRIIIIDLESAGRQPHVLLQHLFHPCIVLEEFYYSERS